MKIERLNITNLRNHEHTILEFSPSINLLHGLNGSGKTTVLEAIAIGAFSKSFLPTSDSSIIRIGNNSYRIDISARNDYGIPYNVEVSYSKSEKKTINSTLGDRLAPKEIIGQLPTVILSPDYKAISFGGPADRRNFLDRLLSQSSKKYLELLLNYRRALKQRNNLLVQAKKYPNFDFHLLDSWTEMLVKTGAEIVLRRANFISEFYPTFFEVYKFISESNEEISLSYAPNCLHDYMPTHTDAPGLTTELIINSYFQFISKSLSEEIKRGVTLFGPQRDDIKIKVNHGIAKDVASQGQHKSILISLKFAEFEYLKSSRNETPIALLDDIFSELDSKRTAKVLSLVELHKAQTFITMTDINLLKPFIPKHSQTAIFFVEQGKINSQNQPAK